MSGTHPQPSGFLPFRPQGRRGGRLELRNPAKAEPHCATVSKTIFARLSGGNFNET
jgi:hypothetical protein